MRSLNKPLTLFDTINSFWQAACQVPRDKVFAALGLVAPAFRTTLQPDYKSSTADVYTELVKYFLNTKHDAYAFLGYACEADDAAEFLSDNDSLRSLPSWVPNWRVPLTITPLPRQIHTQASDSSYGRLKSLFRDPEEIKQRTIRKERAYNACGRYSTRRLSVDGSSLRCDGIHVEFIGEMMHFQKEWIDPGRQFPMFARWKQQIREATGCSEHDYYNTLFRTWVGDVQQLTLLTLLPVWRGYGISPALLEADSKGLSMSERAEQSTMRVTVQTTTRHRALCLTPHLRLALVPYASREEDKICMFFGGQVLYVLRPEGSDPVTHRFIGEAYVFGLMDGEIPDLCERCGIQPETFVLQ